MAKILQWRDNPLTHPVESDTALVPKIYVSPLAPSASELTAVSLKEASDGWPAAVIERNTVRRSTAAQFYHGPQGYSIGPRPAVDIAPGLERSLGRIEQPGARGLRFTNVPGETGLQREARIDAIWNSLFATDTAATAYIKQLVGDDSLIPLSVLVSDRAGDNRADPVSVITPLDNYCSADEDEQFLHVGLHVWTGSHVINEQSGDSLGIVVRFAKPTSGYVGIRGMYFSPMYKAGRWNNAGYYPDKTGWDLARVWASEGLSKYVRLAHPTLTVDTLSASTPSVKWQQNTFGAWNVLEIREFATLQPVLKDWWGNDSSYFETQHSIWTAPLFCIGNPEFVNRFSALGTWDPTQHKLTSTQLVFDWEGARLAEMSPSMSTVDKESVKRLSVSTVIADKPFDTSCRLLDMDVAQAAADAGEPLNTKTYMPSRTQDGEVLPAVTFDEAVARVAGLDSRVWHRQTTAVVSAFDVEVVTISGPSTGVVVTSYSHGVSVSADADFALMCYMEGAMLDTSGFTGGVVNDPFLAAWGFSEFELTSNVNKVKIRRDFDEATVYGAGAPLISKLNTNRRTIMLLSQAALSRKQFSSFVIGSATMGLNARRLLC